MKKAEPRTITVPVEVYVCNRCGAEQVHTGVPGGDMLGWICCHEFEPSNAGPFSALALPPDQHLCPKCKHLVADAVRTAPLPDGGTVVFRSALERIVRECSTIAPKLSPAGIALIAREALEGREATDAQVEAAKPAPVDLSKLLASGRATMIPLRVDPAPQAPSAAPSSEETPS